MKLNERMALYAGRNWIHSTGYNSIGLICLQITLSEYQDGWMVPKFSYYEAPYLNDFHITGQVDWSHGRFQGPYALKAGYSEIGVGNYSATNEAKEKAAFLKKINNVIEKFPVTPLTLGQWLQMLCQGLKIENFLTEKTSEAYNRTGIQYQHHSIKDVQYTIDTRMAEFARIYLPESETKIVGLLS